jgi:hypothetical protein
MDKKSFITLASGRKYWFTTKGIIEWTDFIEQMSTLFQVITHTSMTILVCLICTNVAKLTVSAQLNLWFNKPDSVPWDKLSLLAAP